MQVWHFFDVTIITLELILCSALGILQSNSAVQL